MPTTNSHKLLNKALEEFEQIAKSKNIHFAKEEIDTHANSLFHIVKILLKGNIKSENQG